MPSGLRSRLRLHPLFVDLGLTTVVEFSVVIAGLLVVSLIGHMLGPALLAEYLLLRRVHGSLQSMVLLGARGALARYVARSADKPPLERAGYLVAAVASGGFVVISLTVFLNSERGPFSRLFFGDAHLSPLILPLTLLIVGVAARDLLYAYYRGLLSMKLANALEFCTAVIVPILTIWLFARWRSIPLIAAIMGLSTLLCAGLFAIPAILQTVPNFPSQGIRTYAGELLRYGIPRLPSALGLSVIFAVGPVLAAHYMPLKNVSALLLGTAVLMAVSSSAEPLGLLLLSKASMIVAQNRVSEVRHHFTYLQAAVIEVYAFACLQLLVFADVLVRAWVGSSMEGGLMVMRLVLLAIPFYLVFVSHRNIIDAAAVTPHNTYNIGIAAGLFLAISTITANALPVRFLLRNIAAALVIAITVLAWLTMRTVRQLYNVGIDWRRSMLPLGFSLVLGVTSLLLHWANGFHTKLGEFILIECVTTAIFFALLRWYASPWIRFFLDLAFRNLNRKAVAGHG